MLSTPLHTECGAPVPFAGSTGRGVRIAVVDSGVNPGHPHIGRVSGMVAIGDVSEPLDILGHGTAVMAAIQEKAPDAEYFALKIFDRALRAKTHDLLRAIEWTLGNRIDIVNLSLGTRAMNHLDSFRSLVAEGSSLGVTIVAAREVEGQPCLPGSIPGVAGVLLDWECPRNSYRLIPGEGGQSVFSASGYPRPIPGQPSTRNLNGISFAVANMSGFAALACEGLPVRSPERVIAALRDELTRNEAAP